MILILLGPPGSGKGTQAQMLRDRLGYIHINIGEIFRGLASKTGALAAQIRPIIEEGRLVPDDLTLALVKQELFPFTASCNIVLDGFPRNLAQADGLLGIFESMGLTHRDYRLVNIDAPRDVIVSRLQKRGRKDDTAEVIKTRLEVYDGKTAPVVDYFLDMNKASYVDSNGEKEATFEQILKILQQ